MPFQSSKAVLCDIGGVLYVGNRPIEGAIEAVERLKARYPLRFVTNTTQKTGAQVVKKLRDMGFDIEASEVMTALDMTKRFLEQNSSSAYFVLTNEATAFFDDLRDLPKKYVVVGDARENFSFDILNNAFRMLNNGCELLAAAKNRSFLDEDDQLSMDAGGFVSALEYASAKTARIIGKPSREFYALACEAMGIAPHEALMIGDDIQSDILGAQQASLKTVLVQSGKFRPEDMQQGISPDLIVKSIADLP
jgi:HAD superfamily hydrolase (TIGR01458 family)